MDIEHFTQENLQAPRIPAFLARFIDVALIVVGAILASQIRFDRLAEAHVQSDTIALSTALALTLFPMFRVYQSWRGHSMIHLASQMSLAWFAVQVCGLVLMFSLHRIESISRLWFVYWTGMTGAMLIASRLIIYAVLGRIRNAGLNLRKVAVVGCGAHGLNLIRRIQAAPASGFRVSVAFDRAPVMSVTRLGMPVFDDLAKFSKYVRTEGVQELWLALPLFDETIIRRFINEFDDDLINIRLIPDVSGLALFDTGMSELIGVPAINLIASPLPFHALVEKEIFDRVFATLILIALMPALLIIAIAVKISSPGPVFFRQKRKGADGRVFNIYKFRTMYLHIEKLGVVKQATRDDVRITRLGAFLRRTSLDELPQFINVMRGEMSVVGPRPHALEHDELYRKIVSGYIHRYRIKPGITGWAQVNGYRGETDRIEKMQGRVEHDLYYLRNWSFALDMRIVAATIVKGFTHSNAY